MSAPPKLRRREDSNLNGFPAWLLLAALAAVCSSGTAHAALLRPDGSASFELMSFAMPISTDPLPAGWHHRSFWRHRPMRIDFEEKAGHGIRRRCRLSATGGGRS